MNDDILLKVGSREEEQTPKFGYLNQKSYLRDPHLLKNRGTLI